MINEQIVGVLDRYQIRNRGATHLIVALLLALKLRPKNYKISMSTITKRRKQMRQQIYNKIKDMFELSGPAVVHFDGKLLPSICSNEKEERIAVKVTCGDVDQFLGEPEPIILRHDNVTLLQILGAPISDGTGLETAVAVFNCLEDWRILYNIEACCFDTTATNTGIFFTLHVGIIFWNLS